MARTSKKEEKKVTYKDYSVTCSHNNDFHGRLYLDGKESAKGTRYGLGFTMNGVTIRGCSLWIPADEDKDASIMFPSYKSGESYENYILILESNDREDIKELANDILLPLIEN